MSKALESAGIFLGVLAGIFSFAWWRESRKPKDNTEVDTGEKTPDGKSIVEVTGVGGADGGVSVRGYVLPEKVSDVKLPLTVVVKPNKNLFLDFKVGQKVTFESKLNDELIYKGVAGGGVQGAYYIWYPELKKAALGAV